MLFNCMFMHHFLFVNFYNKRVIFLSDKIKQQCLKFYDTNKKGYITNIELYKITTLSNTFASTQYEKDTILDLNMLFPNLSIIYSNAFRYVTNIKRLIISKSVTTLNTCFYGSTIDEIIIEDLKFQTSMLWGLTFKTIVIKGKTPPSLIIPTHVANYGWSSKPYSKIYVPDEAVNAYKTSKSFEEISQYIFPMSTLPSDFW